MLSASLHDEYEIMPESDVTAHDNPRRPHKHHHTCSRVKMEAIKKSQYKESSTLINDTPIRNYQILVKDFHGQAKQASASDFRS